MLAATLQDALVENLPALITLAAIAALLWGAHAAVRARRRTAVSHDHLREQLLLLGLWLAGIVGVILTIPVGPDTRSQLLTLFGLLLSAVIGLASTTFVGNAMAGLMLKGIRNMNPGDFIEVGDHFGRISDRGLFTTEIQTELRDLVTLPNLYLVTQPVRVVRPSGTIVGAEVSLGYDVSRTRAEARLLEAAEEVGLKDPFVQVKSLGDHSIVYRVAGVQEDVKRMVSSHSRLRKAMIDGLHGDGIEITSPVHEAGRQMPADHRAVPAGDDVHDVPPGLALEQIVFDKADLAVSLERMQAKHAKLTAELTQLQAQLKVEDDPAEVAELESRIHRQEQLLDLARRAVEDRQRRKKAN